MSIARMILIVVVCTGMSGVHGASGDEPTGTPEEIGQFLLEAMLKRAASIVTGEFTGTDEDVVVDNEVADAIKKREFRSTFDFKGPRLRFDYRNTSDDPKNHHENYHYLETSENIITYGEQPPFETTRGPYDGKRSHRPNELFDVRSLGLASLSELSGGDLLPTMEGAFRSMMLVPTGRRLNDENHWELEAAFTIKSKASPNDPARFRYRFVLDADQGYAPILQERFFLNPRDGSGPWLMHSIKVEWKRQDETWVPSDAVMQGYSKNPKHGSRRTLHLDWKSANLDVGDGHFNKSDWTLRPGTQVVDDRGDRPILLYIVQ